MIVMIVIHRGDVKMARIGSQGLVDDGSKNLTVDGTVTVGGTVTSTGATTMSTLTTTGAVITGGSLTVTGSIQTTGTVTTGGALTVTGSVRTTSTITAAGAVTVPYMVMSSTILVGSGTVSIATPGFYYVPATGSVTVNGGYFTGSFPVAATYPGAQIVVCETQGDFGFALTGSAFAATKPVFIMPPGSATGSQLQGTKLAITAGGSVVTVSDGYYWLISAGTGSYTLTGNAG